MPNLGVAMRVLVAGDRGYIGAVLVPFMRAAGHEVDGLDLGLYEGCDLGPGPEDIGARPPRDIRNAEPANWPVTTQWPASRLSPMIHLVT